MDYKAVIGIDLGATNIRGGLVNGREIVGISARPIHSKGAVEEVLEDIFRIADPLMSEKVNGIGIGVPSVVDVEKGIVYDVANIPSWKEVPLKDIMEERYKVPVFINNDANCFALGELYFGKGIGANHMIGLTIGTGIGTGIIINGRLYAGANCGAGEIGTAAYLDHCYEYYASGQFFENVYHTNGKDVFERAKSGDAEAQQWYAEMGAHLGNTIKLVLYAYDPPLIVFGGGVRHAYPYFQETMWEQINSFAYPKSLTRLCIALSELKNSGILGAAGLYYDAL